MKNLFLIPILLGGFFVMSWSVNAQQGYKIDLMLGDSDGEDVFLGYYYLGRTYVKDTARYLGDETYLFQGNEPLEYGMYFFAKGSSLLFDFVIGSDQTFKMRASEDNFVASMQVEGDRDNELYFENLLFNYERRQEAAPYLAIVQDTVSSADQKEEAMQVVDSINTRVAMHQDSIIKDYPESLLANLLKSGKEVPIPEWLSSDESGNQSRKLYYYRKHYWDYFDLGNPLLLRLPRPFYRQKVDDYLDNLTHPSVDSLKMAMDYLIAQSRKEEQTYQHLVWHLTTKYQASKVMGLDELYVHLVDQYFLTGQMDFWANEQLVKNLKEKADQYRNSLIGMVAANLVLQGLDEQPKSLHDLPNKYSVIYFYDPDCGHCKKETPVLKEFYDTTPYDVGIFTVSADSSMTKTKNYIDELSVPNWTNTNGTRTYGVNYLDVYDAYTTPTIFLLNEKKEIIAKKIKADQLNEVIANYERVVKE